MTRIGSIALAALLVAACVGTGTDASPRPPDSPPTTTEPTLEPTREPTASADQTPELTIEDRIRIRRDWGLRSDREWVELVAADPGSVMSELGILVTPEEEAKIRGDMTDSIARLNAYGTRHIDQFGGLYAMGNAIVMLFTGDLEQHELAIAELGVKRAIRVLPCRFSKLELDRVADAVMPEFGQFGPEFQPLTLGVDVINNVVTLEAKSNDPTIKRRLEEPYGGRLVAEIHPLPGAWQNTPAGAGWRLLFAGTHRGSGFDYSVRAAAAQDEWQGLWDELGVGTELPEVDFTGELVVLFGHGIGSSCPEMRLDDVVIDHALELVYSVTSDPHEPRVCTADLVGAAVFAVALERDAVPDRFDLRLHHPPICHDCLAEPNLEVHLRP